MISLCALILTYFQGPASSPDFCGSPPIVSNAANNASLDQQFFDVDTVLSYR